MRKIRFSLHSHLKNMGFKKCLFQLPSIKFYWFGRIINIGTSLLYLTIDWRKNWLKYMITGKAE